MQSEMPTDCTDNTCCLTPSSELQKPLHPSIQTESMYCFESHNATIFEYIKHLVLCVYLI